MIPRRDNYKKNAMIVSLMGLLKNIFVFFTSIFVSSKKNKKSRYGVYFPILTVEEREKIKCNRCGICETICPVECIKISSKKRNLEFSIDYAKCISCGVCEVACPVDAIRLVRRNKYLLSNLSTAVLCQNLLAFDQDLNQGEGIISEADYNIPEKYLF